MVCAIMVTLSVVVSTAKTSPVVVVEVVVVVHSTWRGRWKCILLGVVF